MNRIFSRSGFFYLAAAACLFFLGVSQAHAQTTWNLVWSDEFNGPAGSQPNPAIWTLTQGLTPDGAQSYNCLYGQNTNGCDPNNPNVYLDGNGNLAIVARAAAGAPNGMTTGRLATSNGSGTPAFSTQYGRIEAGITLPVDAGEQGVWPAFWMLGNDITSVNWPASGEIDIMEYVSSHTNTIFGTLHGPNYEYTGLGVQAINNSGWGGYHVYGIIWSPDTISFYVDNVNNIYGTVSTAQTGTGNTNWPFNNPFYILLDLNMGGGFPGNVNGSTTYPQTMLVDYVRVYKAGTSTASPITSGATYNLLNPESSSNLDVTNCGTGNGTNVGIWNPASGTCNSGGGQIWQANQNSDGTYTFINPESGAALDVAACGTTNGSNVQIWAPGAGTCNGGAGQKWSIQTNSNGTYTLVNPESNAALDVAGCGGSGTNVQIWANGVGVCNSGGGQQWKFVPVTSGSGSGGGGGTGGGGTNGALNGAHVVRVSYNTNLVVDDWAASTAAGNTVDLYTANNTAAQSWTFGNAGVNPAGDYNIAVLGANCLEVTGSGTGNGTKVDIAPCNGAANQAWNAVPSGSGYSLQPANASGMCLDSPGWTTTAGTPLQIWQCGGGTNQTWLIN